MKVEAAMLFGIHQPYKIVDIELDKPEEREVLVERTASGLCHSVNAIPSVVDAQPGLLSVHDLPPTLPRHAVRNDPA
jgi:Zn-dependent alcohol dehydrogenase